MKIAAEQVKRGMVFGGGDKRLTATERVGPEMWETNQGSLFTPYAWDLLGCDPALAARPDCEQFGIAEGFDAAVYGFARTREGGAVDLRRECPRHGSIIRGGGGDCVTVGVDGADEFPLVGHERFVGLNGRYASPEDIERLCCGAPRAEQGETFKHITETGKRDVVCTLAIGDHDHHEDIGAGVKWPASGSAAPPESSPLLTIGALRVADFTIANPANGARVIEFTLPEAESRAAVKHLGDDLPIEVRGREKAVTGQAVRWSHGPVSDSRAEWFAVTFREGGDVATPTPVAPKVSPMADVGKQAAVECAEFAKQWARVEKGQAAQVAARDAAVAKAVADVPAGCSAAGWRNVVHVLAADLTEEMDRHKRNGLSSPVPADCEALVPYRCGLAMPKVVAYERERRNGYGKEQAAERVRDGSTTVLRLLAAYEAGR